ncbi:MAG: hypothetical protein R6U98_17450, partial [Pirellulaceae bacterium]
AGKTERAFEGSTAGDPTGPDRRKGQGAGSEGGKARHSHPRTLEKREPAAARSQSTPSGRGSRQPAPAAPRFGRGRGGMGGGMRQEMSKDSDAAGELAAQPPMAEELAEPAMGTDAGDEAGDSRVTSRATTARQLARELEANESLWVQVSVSHDAKMELLKSERNGEEEGQVWGAAVRRLLGTEDDGQVELNVSSAQGRKLPGKNQGGPPLSYSSPDGRVILVEGTKQTLRGSLERLVSRSDIRVNEVSKTSTRELEHARGLVEPLVERAPAQQESESEVTAADKEAKGSRTKMELDQHVPARQEAAERDVPKPRSSEARRDEPDTNNVGRDAPADARPPAESESAALAKSSPAKQNGVEGTRSDDTHGGKVELEMKHATEPGGREESRAEERGEKKETIANAVDNEGAPIMKSQDDSSPPASGPETDRKQGTPRPKGLDALGGGGGQPIKVDSFPVDKTIDEAVRKSVRRMRAAPSKTPATETILHFVFRCTSGAPDAAARESPSGSTPLGDAPESERTRDNHE